MLYKQAENEKGKLEVYYDVFSSSPRDWDNLGMIAYCYRTRKHAFGDRMFNWYDYNSELDCITKVSGHSLEDMVVLPIFFIEHKNGEVELSTTATPQSQYIGWIYASNERIYREYRVDTMTPSIKDKVIEQLTEEIQLLNDFINGIVFCFVLEDPHCNQIDSSGNFVGYQSIEYIKDDIPEEYHELVDLLA